MLGYLGILKELSAHKIRYIVIGGLAVNLHGIPRMTYDIDLLIDFNRSNIAKFEKLMHTLGFKPKMPIAIIDLADQHMRASWIRQKNMKAFNLVNPALAVSELDILIDTPVTYDKAKSTTKTISIEGIAVPVISIQNLMKMKRSSGRDQDMRDIKYLKKVSHAK